MAVNISGDEGSLFWKAGIDLSDFDQAMNKITDQIQSSTQKQILLQQQAAQGQKQIAQSILESAGLIKGMDRDVEAQLKSIENLQQHIQSLKGQSVSLNTKGFDTSELTASLDTVLLEIERIKTTPLELKEGRIDVSGIVGALTTVQAQFDRLSSQTLQLKVGGINTESVEKAFTALQGKIDSLNQTALDLKVKGVDTTSLTTAIEKAKAEFEGLKGLTLNGTATLDITEFQSQYDKLQKSLTTLESEKIQLKAAGIDTTQIEKDITSIRTQAASIQRQALKITVDDASLKTLEQHLQTLKAQSLQFKAAGIDTTQLEVTLSKVQEKIDKIKEQPVELRTGTVNLSPLSVALNNILEQAQKVNGTQVAINVLPVNTQSVVGSFDDLKTRIDQLQQTAIELKIRGVDTASLQGSLDKIKTEVLSLENISINASATLDVSAFERSYQTISEEIKALQTQSIELKAQGIDTTTLDRDITTLRTKLEGLSGEVFTVKVDDSSLINLESHIKSLQLQSLEFKTKGIDTTQIDAALREVQGRIDQIKADPIEVRAGTVNLAPLSTALQGVQKQIEQINGAESLQVFAQKQTTAIEAVTESVDQSEQELKDYLATLQEFKDQGIEVKVNQRAPDSPGANKQLSSFSEEDLRTLENAKQSFSEMDKQTQLFIDELIEMEGRLEAVQKAQKALDEERAKGTISEKQYIESTKALAAEEKNIADTLTAIGQRQREYEKSLEPVIEKTISAQQRLSQLKKEMASNPTSPMFETWKQEAVELQVQIQGVNQELKNAATLQQLNSRKDSLSSLLLTETDTSKVKAYKKEISSIDVEIGKLSNAGKAGFTAVGEEIAKTATKGNLLTKAFGFIRQAALFIPGIGVAGIFSLIGDSVFALVASLFKGAQAFDEIKEKIKLFSEVNTEAAKQAASQVSDLKILYKTATDVNNAMNDRLAAVKALKSEFPDTFANLKNEIILNGQAKASYDELTKSIIDNAKATAAKSKLTDIESKRLDIAFQKQQIEDEANRQKALAKTRVLSTNTGSGGSFTQGTTGQDVTITKEEQEKTIEIKKQGQLKEKEIDDKRLKNKEDFLLKYAGGENALAKAITDGNKQVVQGSVEAIDAQIADQKRLQSHFSTTSKQWNDYQKTIEQLEAKRKQIAGASKADLKAGEALENKGLSQRLDLLKQIAALQRDATQSGLVKEQSELDKVNEKYDLAIQKIKEFNQSKAVQTGKVAPISQDLLDAVNQARSIEVDNTIQKQDAEKFKENLEQQKQLFEQYEEAKKQIGVEKANEMFSEQRKGFTSYADFLRNEFSKMLPKIQLGLPGNVGEQEKLKALFKAGADLQKQQRDQQIEDQKTLFEKTASFVQQKEVLDLQYQRLYKTLKEEREKLGEEEYNRELERLQQAQAADEDALRVAAVKQSDIFKRLGRDLLLQTSTDIKGTIAVIDKALQEGSFKDLDGNIIQLTPELRAQLQNARTQLKGLVDDSKKVADIFHSLGSSVSVFSKGLGEALSLMGDMVVQAKSIKDSIQAFKEAQSEKGTTGLLDQISSAAGVFGGVVSLVGGIAKGISSLFGESEEEKRRKAEYQQFLTNIYTGEFQINQLYRERELTQVRLNDLRLQGAKQELEVLQKQKTEIQKEADEVLQKLQGESFKATKEQVAQFIKDNNLGAFDALKLLQSGQLPLAGKTFEELEKLNAFGQLQGTAKTLFDTLQKLKQEGLDVEQAMKDLQEQLKVDLTGGATKDSIADSIAEGFAQGKRSSADFADTFKELMQKAALAALKLRFLDEPLKKFIEQFQDDVTSGDQLDASEVANLKDFWDKIITNASNAMDQIQKIAGIDFSSVTGSSGANSLQGAIKGITEDTAELLAGQFGAMRLTAIEQLNVAMQSLDRLNQIQNNTFNTVAELKNQTATMVEYFQNKGVKIA
jgi:hypothetical protein